MDIYQIAKKHPIYTAQEIQSLEKRWFYKNSSDGLMQQASFIMAVHIEYLIQKHAYQKKPIIVWCGVGNNGGDGYLIAYYLKKQNYDVCIYAKNTPRSTESRNAQYTAKNAGVPIYQKLNEHDAPFYQLMDCVHIDALFGNGLNKQLDNTYQNIINEFNHCTGLKIAVDIPSGLHPDTGMDLPMAVYADYTLCLIGLKMGLLTAKGRTYTGQIIFIPLLPADNLLKPIAYLDTNKPTLDKRLAHVHKGDFTHTLIIGGHKNMGGAVIMAGESAMACGAGKVTILCHKNHHHSIISRNPNIMVKDIDDIFYDMFIDYLKQIDVVAFGMGLGRDDWSEKIYHRLIKILQQKNHLSHIILDADALYFLSNERNNFSCQWILTPHSAEAGRLLNKNPEQIEQNRRQSIYDLHQKYGGNWVLKGAGSLILEQQNHNKLYVCPFGNAGMATAGMGDVLSGTIAALIPYLTLHKCVNLHALAGDTLANKGQHGLSAHDMPTAIYQYINDKI